MRIAMIGSGYVGLVSGTCFADLGHDVVCIDTEASKIAMLNAGNVPIYEPGLTELIQTAVATGRLRFTIDLAEGLRGADAAFIAVGTPARRGDGYADLRFVYAAARDIARTATEPLVIVTKSTVPVGTGDEIERIVEEENPDSGIGVVSNPEFLKEGEAIDDFLDPDRVVIGADDDRSVEIMRKIYRPLTDRGTPLLVMDRRGAELTKYAANALLATKITFMNEIANLCETVGTDVRHIAHGIGLDTRIGPRFLEAGPGYGGSCFPKDTLALMKTAHDHGTPLRVVEAVVAANDQRKRAMGWRVVNALGQPRGKVAAVLGLTFKANTDDMRDSPSVAIVNALKDAGVAVRAYDPEGMDQARQMIEDITFCETAYDALEDVDVAIIATGWREIADLDLRRVRETMRGDLVADLRNLFDPLALDAAGFRHLGIGRSNSRPENVVSAPPQIPIPRKSVSSLSAALA